MNYMKTVEEFFWKNLEDKELQISNNNVDVLDQAIRLMEIDGSFDEELDFLSLKTLIFKRLECFSKFLGELRDFQKVISRINLC